MQLHTMGTAICISNDTSTCTCVSGLLAVMASERTQRQLRLCVWFETVAACSRCGQLVPCGFALSQGGGAVCAPACTAACRAKGHGCTIGVVGVGRVVGNQQEAVQVGSNIGTEFMFEINLD